MTGQAVPRLVRVAEIMGTAVSAHVVGVGEESADALAAIEGCFAELREVERVFSTYMPGSEVSRIRRGELEIADADPRVCEVAAACASFEELSGGRFSASWDGAFDPTGYVKGWAVERAQERWLRPLLGVDGVVAVGLNAGGDMQLSTAASVDWTWSIGIANPLTPGALAATLQLRDGAVATSGVAERGAHIVDPRSGVAVGGAAPVLDAHAAAISATAISATVIAPRLSVADVWATVAMVAGSDDLTWLTAAGPTNGLVIAADGKIRRWAGGFELHGADAELLGLAEWGARQRVNR